MHDAAATDAQSSVVKLEKRRDFLHLLHTAIKCRYFHCGDGIEKLIIVLI